MHKPTAARAIHTGANSAKLNMLPNQLSTPQSSQAARMPSQHPFFTAAQHVSLVLSAWVYSVYSSVTTSGAVCRYSCWKVVITMFCRLSSCCPSPHNHVNSCKPTNDMRNPPPPLMIIAVEKRCVFIFFRYAWWVVAGAWWHNYNARMSPTNVTSHGYTHMITLMLT